MTQEIDVRSLLARAADALHDAANPGGAPQTYLAALDDGADPGVPQTYLAIERELRHLIAALDEEATRANRAEGQVTEIRGNERANADLDRWQEIFKEGEERLVAALAASDPDAKDETA